ncbi:hypothetical protein TSOC_008233 [Tetrabaena socialis]|uniref:Uncharacterized protein n=1 Tax=Tetrabaena socialis TaxID=47790 RepID=A0A2J7ZZ08_9CHLO|nr:hypothetical protein TSOC_008233 [Tetrabaena socialis]|eukprot:PNH05503.1 hypothetical protein TSOC_008233 [Tetrabaena socialis]
MFARTEGEDRTHGITHFRIPESRDLRKLYGDRSWRCEQVKRSTDLFDQAWVLLGPITEAHWREHDTYDGLSKLVQGLYEAQGWTMLPMPLSRKAGELMHVVDQHVPWHNVGGRRLQADMNPAMYALRVAFKCSTLIMVADNMAAGAAEADPTMQEAANESYRLLHPIQLQRLLCRPPVYAAEQLVAGVSARCATVEPHHGTAGIMSLALYGISMSVWPASTSNVQVTSEPHQHVLSPSEMDAAAAALLAGRHVAQRHQHRQPHAADHHRHHLAGRGGCERRKAAFSYSRHHVSFSSGITSLPSGPAAAAPWGMGSTGAAPPPAPVAATPERR